MTVLNQLDWQRDNFENIEEAWQGDLWDRRRLGVQLTNYVDSLNCGAVLALDARWGEGKTWFVRHWQKHLEDEKHNVVYLDAFANDYLDDPFLVISSEITACLSKDDANSSHINTFKEKAAAAYQALLPTLPKVLLTLGLNLISGGVLGTLAQQVYESGEKVIESATDGIGDKIKESIEAKIESHEADKNTLLAFKQELTQLAKEFDKPLVFIIDELDRCRPDFAIRLIERIKHFFDIPKIVFVLVMDKTQFSKVVCHNYGYDEKIGEEYLDKFIDFTVPLPQISCPSFDEQILHVSILQNLLFKIGEESEDICLIFYLAQFGSYLSPRQLQKKIHQYALLKTHSIKKNMFLVLALLKGAKKLHEKILETARILDGLQKNQDVSGFVVDVKRLDFELIKGMIKAKFKLEADEYFEFMEKIKQIEYENFGVNEKQKSLDRFYSNFALQKFKNNHYEISDQFELYLKGHLWTEGKNEQSQ